MNRIRALAREYPEWTDAVILIIGFALGANLFIFFKMSGLNERYMETIFDSYRFHWITPTIAGLVIGTGFAILEFNVFPKLKIRQLGLLFLIRLISFTLVIVVSIFAVQTIIGTILQGHPLRSTVRLISHFMETGLFFSLYVYLMILGGVLNFFRAMGNRFGPGLLLNYISGKYNQPIEENRVFMFLDLNDSTTLAEDMGHEKYSRMLNELFSTVAKLAAEHNGEIYQYVGDEAVITWLIDEEFRFTNPVRLYQQFRESIQAQTDRYKAEYQTVPGFNASIHGGPVIVTEMGHRRKELAYHGDVMNTASRLLDRGSELGKELVISSFSKGGLPDSETYQVEFVENLVLKGKKTETEIYEVIFMHSAEKVT